MEAVKVRRPTLQDLDLSTGKRTRLYRLLYTFGPANGTLLFLPVDQGLEHGPRDFFANPESLNPEYQLRLAKDGGYSGIVFHIGLAEKYLRRWAGEVPLVLKLNGKTDVPSDRQAFSPQTASVADAVRLGADAVGYTLYIGSPAQDRDFVQFAHVRGEAERFGMPVIAWAYPRGEAIEAKGGRDSFYAVDYAARVATELGADVVKLNIPVFDEDHAEQSPEPYGTLRLDESEMVRKVVLSAGKTLVLFSGGERISDDALITRARMVMEAGATGLIFGRNMWQRHYRDAMRMTEQIKRMLADYAA
ncbi:MAG: fructose-bisphosphate aldolase [Chloroflexi bacterium]|nr:fructose-bisphosphate aldolase [Chloroflexota bacterium]